MLYDIVMFVDVQVFSDEGEYWFLVLAWSFHLFGIGYVRCLMVLSWFFRVLTNVGEFGVLCMYWFPYAVMTMRRLWMQRVGWLSITWNDFVWESTICRKWNLSPDGSGYSYQGSCSISASTSFAHVGCIVMMYNSFWKQIQWTIGNSLSNCIESVFMWRNA